MIAIESFRRIKFIINFSCPRTSLIGHDISGLGLRINNKKEAMIYFLILVFTYYFFFTLNFAIKFNKTDTTLNNNQKLLHNILIWVIPFFWIIILNAIVTPVLGPGKSKTKSKAEFYDSDIGIWYGDGGHHHHGTDEGHGHNGDD